METAVNQEIWRGVIVDDKEPTLSLYKEQLEKTGRVKVIGCFTSGETLLSNPETIFQADFLLIDLKVVTMNGLEIARQVRLLDPRKAFIVYTSYPETEYLSLLHETDFAIKWGFVARGTFTDASQFLPILKKIIRTDGWHISPDVDDALQRYRVSLRNAPERLLRDPDGNLRQSELVKVFELNGRGLSSEIIAIKVGIPPKRVTRCFNVIFFSLELEGSFEMKRLRAAIIYLKNLWIIWDRDGLPKIKNSLGQLVSLEQFEAEQQQRRSNSVGLAQNFFDD